MLDTVVKLGMELRDRRAAAYLMLTTRVVALAPMAIFLANPALFLSLDAGKLLLLSAALSLPALMGGVAIHLYFAEMEAMDRRTVIGFILTGTMLSMMEAIAVFWIWLTPERGLRCFVYGQALALAVMVYTEMSERAKWRKAQREDEPPADELRDFARAHPGRFAAWRRDREKPVGGT